MGFKLTSVAAILLSLACVQSASAAGGCGPGFHRGPLWSVQTKWTRGLPGGAGCCGARTSRTPANGLRRWLSLASLLQALRGSLRQSTFFCR